MLQKQGENLSIICEMVKTSFNGQSINDIREKTDWNRTDKRFITYYNYSAFPTNPISTDFQNNGIPWGNIAPIGTRPNCNLRLSVTTPGQYYLIKFSDNSVRLSNNDVEYTSTPQGTVIGLPEENLKFLIGELQGAGGGGSGGGTIFSGTGGAGGGYILGLINLEHDAGANWKQNSIPLQVGTGGAGVRDRNQAGNGEDTGFYVNSSLALCASGGNGADGGDPGSHRGVAISGVDSIFYSFYYLNGNDGRSGGGSNSISQANSPAVGPSSENVILSYPETNASGGYGGSGGCCRLSGGGDAYSSAGHNGGDAKGPGGGGGGGSGAPASYGGNGGNGLINFYY